MKKINTPRAAQGGFTLIELIVVIVVLGILAATALPKFTDTGTDARIAKMKAAVGAVQSASAMVHGAWLTAGSPQNGGTTLTAEGVTIPYFNGYPDVGGDGGTNTAKGGVASGIVLAAGLGANDYTVDTASATVLKIMDAQRPGCYFTYTEAIGTTPAVVTQSNLTANDCK